MMSQEQLEQERAHALESLRDARRCLQPTSRSRLFGVTGRMLDKAYEKEKAAIEALYEARIANTGHSRSPEGEKSLNAQSKFDSAQHISGSILTRDEVADKALEYRSHGRTIVLTNGCFDLIHRGHIGYLAEARRLGDVLILGLNGDDSVRRLKGNGRPILPVQDRAEILIALRSVDHVVVFDEDTAEDLVDAVRPNIYVKGGDYSPEFPTPEARRAAIYGGAYHVLSYIESASTSQLIERITQSVQ